MMNKISLHEGWSYMIEFFVGATQKRNLEHPESSIPQSTVKALKNLQRNAAVYPMFIIDNADLMKVLSTIGKQVLDSMICEGLRKILTLPYKHTVIVLNTSNFVSNDIIAPIKQDLWTIGYSSQSDNLYGYGITRSREYTDRLQDWDITVPQHAIEIKLILEAQSLRSCIKAIDLDQIDDVLMENPYADPGIVADDSRIHMTLGLIIALNSKEIVDSELVRTKEKMIIRNGKVKKTARSSYHKLTLTLKGKEYSEYLQEKASGVKRDKNSPRSHWRRGHFKFVRGQLRWWSACIVSKKQGVVIAKDYMVVQ